MSDFLLSLMFLSLPLPSSLKSIKIYLRNKQATKQGRPVFPRNEETLRELRNVPASAMKAGVVEFTWHTLGSYRETLEIFRVTKNLYKLVCVVCTLKL